MTKVRPPLSFDAALARIAGQIPGAWEAMATLTNRVERTVRNWGDPDAKESVPIDCAIVLDLAYQAAGGTGAPLYETYAHQLELAEASKFADRHELLRHAQSAIKETGEATSAIIGAAHPDATEADRQRAIAEAAEGIDALKNAMHLLGAQPP